MDKFYTTSVKFIFKYFVVFDTTVDGTVFLLLRLFTANVKVFFYTDLVSCNPTKLITSNSFYVIYILSSFL